MVRKVWVSGSQSVLWWSKGIHDQFPWDLLTHLCNGNFEVYLFFKSKEEGFVKSDHRTFLIGNVLILYDC